MADMMGVDRAAAILGMDPVKVRRLLRMGVIQPEMRLGRTYVLSRREVNRVKKLGLNQDLRGLRSSVLEPLRKSRK